jgi:hypothetical protein
VVAVTDLEVIKKMLSDRGIDFDHETHPDQMDLVDVITVTAPAGDRSRVSGYPGFFSELTFNGAGELIKWGCWE